MIREKIFHFLKKMRLVDQYETFSTANVIGTGNDFYVPKDMEIRGGLHINRNVIVFGKVTGNIVVEGVESSSILVMPEAQVSHATLRANRVETQAPLDCVSIECTDLTLAGGSTVTGDSEVRYSGDLCKAGSVRISGRFEFLERERLADIPVKPSRTRIF